MADVGINVDLVAVDQTTLEGIRISKEYEGMFMIVGGVTSPTTTLYSHWEPGWKANTSVSDDPVYNEQYPLILAERDPVLQAALIKELSVHLLNQSHYFFMPTPYVYRYAWPWVKNYYGENNIGYFDAAPIYGSLWIDQDLKADMGY